MIAVNVNPDWDLPLIAKNAGADNFYYRDGLLYADCEQSDLNTSVAEYDPVADLNAKKVVAFTAAVQAHMDGVARGRGYDDIFTAVSYSTSTHATFGPEGIAFRDWRDDVWTICHGLLADWQAGGTEPTINDVITGLPAYPG